MTSTDQPRALSISITVGVWFTPVARMVSMSRWRSSAVGISLLLRRIRRKPFPRSFLGMQLFPPDSLAFQARDLSHQPHVPRTDPPSAGRDAVAIVVIIAEDFVSPVVPRNHVALFLRIFFHLFHPF